MLLNCMYKMSRGFMNLLQWCIKIISLRSYDYRLISFFERSFEPFSSKNLRLLWYGSIVGDSFLKVSFSQSCIHFRTTSKIATMHFVPAFVDDAFIPFYQSRFPVFARKIAFTTY